MYAQNRDRVAEGSQGQGLALLGAPRMQRAIRRRKLKRLWARLRQTLGDDPHTRGALITTTYGLVLSTKFGLWLAMGAVGLLDAMLLRLVGVPLPRRFGCSPGWTPVAFAKLPVLIRCDVALALLVVLATGFITAAPAPRGPEFKAVPKSSKRIDKLQKRNGRLKAQSRGIGRHYQITVTTDAAGKKDASLTWEKKPLTGTMLTHAGVLLLAHQRNHGISYADGCLQGSPVPWLFTVHLRLGTIHVGFYLSSTQGAVVNTNAVNAALEALTLEAVATDA